MKADIRVSPSSPSTRKSGSAGRRKPAGRAIGPSSPPARGTSWREVASRLECEIGNNKFEQNRRLPTEAILAASLGTTRHTLRAAIDHLVGKGILRREPYVGTFIAPQRIELTISPTVRFIDSLQQAGIEAEYLLVSHRRATPPPDISRQLGVPARSEVVEIVRLVCVNQAALGCVTAWLPAERLGRVSSLITTVGSLRRALAQLGVTDTRRKCARIVGRLADDKERQLMAAPRQLFVLGFDGVSVDAYGEPTHAYTYVLDARRVALSIAM